MRIADDKGEIVYGEDRQNPSSVLSIQPARGLDVSMKGPNIKLSDSQLGSKGNRCQRHGQGDHGKSEELVLVEEKHVGTVASSPLLLHGLR